MVSYETFIEHYTIPSQQLEEECSDEVLRKISSKFDNWRNAAPHFELDDEAATIDRGNHDDEGKSLELLRRWKQKFGFLTTNKKLIRCLLDSKRADLAGIVAEEIKGNDHRPDSSTSDGASSDMPDSCKPFTSPTTASEEFASPSRGTAPSPIPKDDDQHPISMKAPQQQSSEQNGHSKLVTQATRPNQQTSTRITDSISDGGHIFSRLTDMSHVEKKETMNLEKREKADLLQTEQKDKEKRLAKKRKKIQELKERAQEREKYIQERESEIKKLEQKKLQAKNALEEQKQLLESKENEICQLQRSISQKKMKEQDEKQQKSEQLISAEQEYTEGVARPHQKPCQDLEKDKKEKDIANEQFEQVSQLIMILNKDISKAKCGVSTAHGEKHCLDEMVQWAEDDLFQEQQEISREKKILMAHRAVIVLMYVVMVFLFVFIFIVVGNMLPQCTCI